MKELRGYDRLFKWYIDREVEELKNRHERLLIQYGLKKLFFTTRL